MSFLLTSIVGIELEIDDESFSSMLSPSLNIDDLDAFFLLLN